MAGSMGGFSFDAGGVNQMLAQRQNQSQFLRKLLSDEMAQAAQARNAEQALALQRELGMGGLALDRDRFGLEGELARGAMGLNRDRFGFEQEQGRAATGMAGRKLDLDAMAADRTHQRDLARIELDRMGITDKREQDRLLDERERIKLGQGAAKLEQEGSQFERRLGFDEKRLGAEQTEAEKSRAHATDLADRKTAENVRLTEMKVAAELNMLRETAKLNQESAVAADLRAYELAQTPIEKAKAFSSMITSALANPETSAIAASMLEKLFNAEAAAPSFGAGRPNSIAGVMGGKAPPDPKALAAAQARVEKAQRDYEQANARALEMSRIGGQGQQQVIDRLMRDAQMEREAASKALRILRGG